MRSSRRSSETIVAGFYQEHRICLHEEIKMTTFSDKVDVISLKIIRAENKLQRLKEERGGLLRECPHTSMERKSFYIPGSYYDKSYTEFYDECRCCGKQFNYQTSSGYYE